MTRVVKKPFIIPILKAAGFAEEAGLKERLRTEDRWMDTVIYTRTIPKILAPFREIDAYYGTRKQWQVERIDQGK